MLMPPQMTLPAVIATMTATTIAATIATMMAPTIATTAMTTTTMTTAKKKMLLMMMTTTVMMTMIATTMAATAITLTMTMMPPMIAMLMIAMMAEEILARCGLFTLIPCGHPSAPVSNGYHWRVKRPLHTKLVLPCLLWLTMPSDLESRDLHALVEEK